MNQLAAIAVGSRGAVSPVPWYYHPSTTPPPAPAAGHLRRAVLARTKVPACTAAEKNTKKAGKFNAVAYVFRPKQYRCGLRDWICRFSVHFLLGSELLRVVLSRYSPNYVADMSY